MVAYGGAWAPDGQTLYVSATDAGIAHHLYAVSVTDGSVRRLTSRFANYSTPVVSADGRWLACTVEEPDRLTEVWLVAVDGSEARPVSDANRRLGTIEGLHLLESACVRWRSVDGLVLEGMLLYPPGCGPTRPPVSPLPTVVDVHGGPLGITPWLRLNQDVFYLDGLHGLAEHGYLCFQADYRHSGTYGWPHRQRIVDTGEHVGLDAADVLSGVDHLVTAGLADPARLGLRGYSYGAYLANWLVTQTDRFRAAVSIEGTTHADPFPQPNTIMEVAFRGAFDEVPERYRRQVPLTFAAQARTPMLLVEGQHGTARFQQGQVFADALRAAGVDVEYVCYPGEGHALSRPEHKADFLRRGLAWYQRYLRE